MPATKLSQDSGTRPEGPVIGVFSTCDPRIDEESRERTKNIIRMVADAVSQDVKLPDGSAVPVVYSDVLVEGEVQADAGASATRWISLGVTSPGSGRGLLTLQQQRVGAGQHLLDGLRLQVVVNGEALPVVGNQAA